MKTFQKIEADYGSQPVVSAIDDCPASGTLILAGSHTEAVLQSGEMLPREANEDGWFDLSLRAANGRRILLHNALISQSTHHHSATGASYEEHVYPNTVVLGAEALAPGDRVKVISFTVREMALFFHHHVMESLSVHEAPETVLLALRSLRRPRSRQDIFRPTSAYVIHRFPRTLRFTVEGRVYEVFSAHSESLGNWRKIDCESEPVGTITFPEPVSLDTALGAVWQWKRYFSIVALKDLPWTALSARAGNRRRDREANIYLPQYGGPLAENGRRAHDSWPGNVPLNRWSERRALQTVMANWVAREPERQQFRSAIERVAGRFRVRISVDDILTLCSGIESLGELDPGSSLTRDHVRLMAAAANAAAAEHQIPIEPARVSGVLGYLRNPGLPQRLRALFSRLDAVVTEDQARTVVTSIQQLRTVAAHGLPAGGDVLPRVGPTVEALVAACGLYDVLTCGLPIRTASDIRLGLASQLESAIFELDHINAEIG